MWDCDINRTITAAGLKLCTNSVIVVLQTRSSSGLHALQSDFHSSCVKLIFFSSCNVKIIFVMQYYRKEIIRDVSKQTVNIFIIS
jgi:uncharacterized Fe-S radical SAM superfamily protein PflX